MISPPVAVEPVKATFSTPGCWTRCAPTVGPGPGTTLIAPGGKPTSAASSAIRSADQRRRGVGLQDDRAARGERGRELPRRHHQRVVPRHDLAADADRLLQRVEEERAADRVRAAGDRGDRGGVEAEVLDRLRELGLDRRDRLADVARLELGQLLAVRDDRVGERVQQPRALGRRRLAPVAVERGAGGLDGAVDVLPRSPPPTRASGSPVAGSASSRVSPEAGSVGSPLMKSPYSRSVATAICGDDTGSSAEFRDAVEQGDDLGP